MGSVAPDGSRSARNKISDSLYLGGPYADALAFLCSPAVAPRNVKVLVSEPGLGKTILLRAALSQLAAEMRSTYIFWTNFEATEFVAYLLKEMGSREATPLDLGAAKEQFAALLKSNLQVGKGVVLAIDEAQNLSPAALENLGVLLDCEPARDSQLLVLLSGLPSLQDHLADPRAKKLRERICGVMTLEPLSALHRHAYIRQRWGEAAAELAPEMLAAVDNTMGIPRLIDQLFDRDVVSEAEERSILRFDRAANPSARALPLDGPLNVEEITALLEPVTEHVDTQALAVQTSALIGENPVASALAEWANARSGQWSGTVAELAAAAGLSQEQVSSLLENETAALRDRGVIAEVHRAPGRPRMVKLSPVTVDNLPFAGPEMSHAAVTAALTKPDLTTEPISAFTKTEELGIVNDPGSEPDPPLPAPVAPWRTSGVKTSPQESAPVIPVSVIASPSQQSPWERLGWPAIFGIALFLLVPLIWAVFYFTNSSAAEGRPSAAATTNASAVGDSVDGAPPPLAAQPTTRIANASAPTSLTSPPSSAASATPSERALTAESLRIPAQVGDPEAQYKLGLQLASSKTQSDLVSAYAWLVLARAGGQPVDDARLHAIAQKLKSKDIFDVRYKLGLMYEKGIGCQPDPVTADTWYLLAASAGDSRSRSASNRLEAEMTKPQISDARQRATEWTRTHTATHP